MTRDTSLGRLSLAGALPSGVRWAALAALLMTWFFAVAPTQLGGPATFVIVDGHSMEPMLHTGDLAIARRQSSYQPGDLVVFRMKSGQRTGFVIHRLIEGSTGEGWTTKGDNNPRVDQWTVSNEAIAGTYWAQIPGFGTGLAWSSRNSLGVAAIAAGLSASLYLPWRRRRLSPVLRQALINSSKELRRNAASAHEYYVLLVSGGASVAALALVGLLGMSHTLTSVHGLIAGLALAWAGGFTVFFAYRLFDGLGFPEPSKSLSALSGRLHLVEGLPDLDTPAQPVASAIALRTIAERYRLPVLHRIDPDTGAHEFLLITVQKGGFRWTALPAAPAPRHDTTTQPVPAPAVLQPASAAVEPLVEVDRPALAPEKGDRRRAVRRTRWRERRRRNVHDRYRHEV